MSFVSLVRRAVTSPDRVGPYLRIVGRSLAKMVSRGRYAAAAGYLSGELFGTDIYLRRLVARSASGLVVRRTRYGTMVLDARDPGLSRRVLRYGVHEETSSRVYERELARLARDVDGKVGVLELGANLGYFLLLAATVLGERAAMYAVEPHPRNATLLAENVAAERPRGSG